MKNSLSITVVGWSLTVLFTVTYVLAVIFCIVAAWLSPTACCWLVSRARGDRHS